MNHLHGLFFTDHFSFYLKHHQTPRCSVSSATYPTASHTVYSEHRRSLKRTHSRCSRHFVWFSSCLKIWKHFSPQEWKRFSSILGIKFLQCPEVHLLHHVASLSFQQKFIKTTLSFKYCCNWPVNAFFRFLVSFAAPWLVWCYLTETHTDRVYFTLMSPKRSPSTEAGSVDVMSALFLK